MAFGVALPIGMLSMGSGKGCCLLGLGDCLGIGVGGMVAVGQLFFCRGGPLCVQSKWRRWRCLPK